MRTRPLYDFPAEDFQAVSLTMDELLEQDNGLYDNNWIISADDLFGNMDLPLDDYNPYQNMAA